MAPSPLAGQVAIVTGASRGIGRAIALRLGRDGARVVVNYVNGAEAAGEVVEEIGSKNAVAIKADIGNVDDIGSLVDATVEKFGKIDILIACAGIMELAELESITEASYDRTFAVNVKGPLFLVQVGDSTFSDSFEGYILIDSRNLLRI
jgi:3-oxoacyl-[acyl-carrier protein] reductase